MRDRRPTNHRRLPRHAGPAGFTLVELLIVIGIIAVLISILLPTVGKVRIAGQKVATQALLNRISQGCEAYFQDQGAYPGPFADDQLVHSAGAGDPLGTTPYLTPPSNLPLTDGGANFTHAPTTSENLFLGLCGGLRVNTVSGTTTFTYDAGVAKRGLGPAGLNANTPGKKSQSYLDVSDSDISAGEETRNPLNDALTPTSIWWPSTGGVPFGTGFVGDSQVYEFVDRFSKPKPILYLRANRGATRDSSVPLSGFIYDTSSTAARSNTTPYQYRADQITLAYSGIGKLREGTQQAAQIWSADLVDYPAAPVNPDMAATGTNVKFRAGDERYFVNEATATGNPNTTANAANMLVPQQKDKFILISAGPDGLFGTADDIRN